MADSADTQNRNIPDLRKVSAYKQKTLRIRWYNAKINLECFCFVKSELGRLG